MKGKQGSIRDNSCWILYRCHPWSWCNEVSEAEGLQSGRADMNLNTYVYQDPWRAWSSYPGYRSIGFSLFQLSLLLSAY